MATRKERKTTIAIFGFVSILIMAAWLLVFVTQVGAETQKTNTGQTNDKQIKGRSNNFEKFGPPIVFGTVVTLDHREIIITDKSGQNVVILMTPITTFVKEISIKKNQLKKGNNILVHGMSTQKNIIRAERIIVQDTLISERPAPPPPRRQDDVTPEMGPASGKITVLDPLTISLISGETRTVVITDSTKLIREILLKPSEILRGMKVRILAPPALGPEGEERRRALRIIVDTEGETDLNKGLLIPPNDKQIKERSNNY